MSEATSDNYEQTINYLTLVYIALITVAIFLLINRTYNIKISGSVSQGYESIQFYFSFLYAFGIDKNS